MGLGLTYAEYLGSALRAQALNRGALVLQGNPLWILDLHFLLALHAVCLCHGPTLLFVKIFAESST